MNSQWMADADPAGVLEFAVGQAEKWKCRAKKAEAELADLRAKAEAVLDLLGHRPQNNLRITFEDLDVVTALRNAARAGK